MKYIAALLCILTLALPLQAQERLRLPTVTTNDADEKCLNTEQWQRVILMYSAYVGLYEWRLEIEPALVAFQEATVKFEKITDKLELQIQVYERDREYLTLRLKQSEDMLNKRVRSNKFEKVTMWAVIVAETVIIGILGIRGASE